MSLEFFPCFCFDILYPLPFCKILSGDQGCSSLLVLAPVLCF